MSHCFFSKSEVEDIELTEERVLELLKSQYPVILSRSHLESVLCFHNNFLKLNEILITLINKKLVNKFTIFHINNDISVVFNGFIYNLGGKKDV